MCEDRQQKAMELFKSGYSCSQAVAVAFADVMGMDENQVARLSSPFGGGFGRMREVCGCVSGMGFVLGALYGFDDASDARAKALIYERTQAVAGRFKDECGSIVCRELLGLDKDNKPVEITHVPEARTEAYYKKRPCGELVGVAATIVDEYIKANPV